jgi:dTDP-4-amino-4,6-dideoxygalactose transaminase
MITVTKPFLPPLSEYQSMVEGIWEREWLTNNGPLLNELELKLKSYLDVNHMLFICNGTVALQMAIKALNLTGEIITTPFSYVATTSSIVWEGCTPIFADIDASTFNIDPKKIEEKVTEKTTAILATHVFGNPCNIDAIDTIAKKHHLKVIYDAAHCFGTMYKGKTVFSYGDISTTSFHATKIFQTIEGGAVFTNSAELLKSLSLLRNFGHTSPVTFDGMGINGKNSEFHAAMGLCNLKYIDEILEKRKAQWLYYSEKLANFKAGFLEPEYHSKYNYSYFPIVFPDEEQLNKSLVALNNQYIFPRRYFYPSLNNINYVASQPCPVSESVSSRVICLPLYHTLSNAEQDMICRILLRVQNN